MGCSRLLWVVLVFCVMAQGSGGSAPAGDSVGKAGQVDRYVYGPAPASDGRVIYTYQLYVPPRYGASPRKGWPLLVMMHGCGTTADQQMYANLINEIADAEDFLVMYPDNGGTCWRAVSHEWHGNDLVVQAGLFEAGGNSDVIAGATRQTMERYSVDPERIYIIGMSSGAFQAATTALFHPDLYAAAGVHSGGGYYMGVDCLAQPDATAAAYAKLALDALGDRARIIPFISIGGDQDQLGEYPGVGCSRKALLAAMAVNNVISGGMLVGDTATGGRYAQDSSSTANGQVPNGYAWTRNVWRDTAGCEISEQWIVHGMAHYWSGGSTDPKYWDTQPNGAAGFNDPKGPSASRAAWEFFRRFRKSDTGNACAESRL